jgi:RNA polymerase sigma-70 factor, ECF subfamily
MPKTIIGNVYEQSHDSLRALATRFVGWYEAEDVVQDAFVKALMRHGRFRGDATPRTWVTRIVINAAIDRSRAISRCEARHIPLDAIPSAARPICAELDRRFLLVASMAELSRRERRLMFLHYVWGYSTGEIAQSLNIPRGTVKSRLFDLRRRLRLPRRLGSVSAVGT